jgi:hypothetical protein
VMSHSNPQHPWEQERNVSIRLGFVWAIFAILVTAALLGGCILDSPAPEEPDAPPDAVYVHGSSGNDDNPGTSAEPFLTIQAAVDYAASLASKPEVRVAAGTYSSDYRSSGTPVVVLKEGIELYGGYSEAGWGLRDGDLYPTVIEDASTAGGSPADPNRALASEPGTSSLSLVDGFVIRGGGGDISFALFLAEASPRIRNCTVEGGTGSSFSAGIYNFDTSSPTIEDDDIRGGSGDVSFGIYNYDGCAPLIQGCRVSGSGSGTQSLGIYNDVSSPAEIRNNLIDGGDGAYSLGIMSYDSSPVIRNNTVCGGHNAASWTVALFNQTAAPVIQNNIIFTAAGSGRLGVYEYDSTSDPAALQNNDIYACPTALY